MNSIAMISGLRQLPPYPASRDFPPSGWQNKPLYTFLQNHAAPCESSDMLSFRGKVVAPASKGAPVSGRRVPTAVGGQRTADSRQRAADITPIPTVIQ